MPKITQELADRRKSSRYELRFSVRFSWKSLPGVWLYGEGFTRNVSITGLYVYTQTCPPVQAVLRTEFLLPGIWDQEDIRAECEMKVQRVEQDLRGPKKVRHCRQNGEVDAPWGHASGLGIRCERSLVSILDEGVISASRVTPRVTEANHAFAAAFKSVSN